MSQVITQRETASPPVSFKPQGAPFEVRRQTPSPEKQPSAPWLGSLVRGILLIGLAGVALTLLAFALVPGVFVAFMLFLPALAPIILVVLGIVLTGDLERPGCAGSSQRQA